MIISQIRLYSLYLVCFTLPINQYLNVRLLIATFLLSLINVKAWKSVLKNSWSILFYLAVLVLGLAYSNDLQLGLRVLETNFSFVAIPVIIGWSGSLSEKTVMNLVRCFGSGLLIASLICLGNATVQFYQSNDLQHFFFYQLTGILGLQPTYFAYYLIFGITCGLYVMYYKPSNDNWLGMGVAVLLFFFMLLLTGGRTAFIGLLLIFAFFILKYLVEERTTRKMGVLVLVLTMLLTLFFVSFTEVEWRDKDLNDSWERMILWESAVKAMPDVFFGVGTGDYKEALNSYYVTHQLERFANDSLNSHNQVIQLLFSNGLLGVLAFALLLGHPLYLAVKNQNLFAILVQFPFVVYGITEVFLGRYQGVVFFALLHQIMIVWIQSEKPTLNRIESL